MQTRLDTSAFIRSIVGVVPAVRPWLNGRALAFVFSVNPSYKTQEYFEATVEHLIQQLYDGNMDGSTFIDIMDSLISGQLYDAYVQAWESDENTLPLPDFLQSALDEAVVNQQDFVQGLEQDVVIASVDKTGAPTERAALWANNWTSEYNNAQVLITSNTGGNMMWVEGDTKDKCTTCLALDGIVAYATEWQDAGVQPRNAPNDMIECGGWNCNCTLEATDQRRSPNAADRIQAAIG